MVMCWAYGCNHYNNRDTCRCYRIPKEISLRRKWIKALRRKDTPGPGAFVCSCHFRVGNKENLPEIFSYNKNKSFGNNYLSPEKKKRNVQQTPVVKGLNLPSTSKHQDLVTVASSESVSARSHSVHVLSSSALEAEIFLLNLQLEKEANKSYCLERFSFDKICHDDNLICLYTGLPQTKIFDTLYDLVKDIDINYIYGSRVDKINKKDQLLLTLMKLRQNFRHADLALRFKISETTVSNVVITWVHVLYEILYQQLMSTIPSRNKNKSCLPNSFSTFTNCRIILDCTEIFIMVPRKSMSAQKATYSSYKHHNTFKGLIGTAPNGVITFVSDLYPGSTSDKQIVTDCGVLEKLTPGDLILADKGFLINDILPPGVNLNIPPFLVTTQFTKAQIQQAQTIARARIHVERAIRRIKCFKILNLIPHTLSQYADVIFKVCAALTNLQYPLLKEIENFLKED